MSAARQDPVAAEEGVRDRAARIARAFAGRPDATPADLLMQIEEALADSDLLPLVWPHIVAALRREMRVDRTRISGLLARMWAASHRTMGRDDLRAIAHIAYACFDVRTARRAIEQVLRHQEPSINDMLLKAMCLAAVGDLPGALAACETAHSREPYNLNAIYLRRRWKRRIDSWEAPWRVPVQGDGMLLLEPLDAEHGPALAWQYRDEAISRKTVLPVIDAPGEVQKWIERRQAESAAVYALIHREHGFIGSAELSISGAEAFLCVWIGVDWQRRGFGRALIDLACRHAFASGIEVLLTAAFDNNTASIRALRGCGFTGLPVRAAEPDHERTFLYHAPRPIDHDEVVHRLIDFCTRTDTGLVFPPAAVNEDLASGLAPAS